MLHSRYINLCVENRYRPRSIIKINDYISNADHKLAIYTNIK